MGLGWGGGQLTRNYEAGGLDRKTFSVLRCIRINIEERQQCFPSLHQMCVNLSDGWNGFTFHSRWRGSGVVLRSGPQTRTRIKEGGKSDLPLDGRWRNSFWPLIDSLCQHEDLLISSTCQASSGMCHGWQQDDTASSNKTPNTPSHHVNTGSSRGTMAAMCHSREWHLWNCCFSGGALCINKRLTKNTKDKHWQAYTTNRLHTLRCWKVLLLLLICTPWSRPYKSLFIMLFGLILS